MGEGMAGLIAKIGDAARRHRRAMQQRIARWRRAFCYLAGRLSADDAQSIFLDCRYPAGWHPLLILSVDDTLEQALKTFADHPELARLVADGCARVGQKWESYGDELYEAHRWAIDVAEGYALDEGISLPRREV